MDVAVRYLTEDDAPDLDQHMVEVKATVTGREVKLSEAVTWADFSVASHMIEALHEVTDLAVERAVNKIEELQQFAAEAYAQHWAHKEG